MNNLNLSILETYLKKLVAEIMIYSGFTSNIGLMYGKTGICIFLFHVARHTKDKVVEEYAEHILDDIFAKITPSYLYNFSSGLCGIAWGIHYLLDNGFVDADEGIDEIMEEIDGHLWDESQFVEKDKNIMHMGWYIMARMTTTKNQDLWMNRIEIWIKCIYKLFDKKEQYPSDELIPILYCYLYSLRYSKDEIFPRKVSSIINYLEEQNKLNRQIILELLTDVTRLNCFDYLSKTVAINEEYTLQDINSYFLIHLLKNNNVKNFYTPYYAALHTIVSDEQRMTDIFLRINPQNIGLKGYTGSLSWSILCCLTSS